MRPRIAAFTLCLLVWTGLGARARAEDTAPAPAPAQALVDEGRALFKEGQFGLALGRFEQALEGSGVPGIQYLIGRCHQELGNPGQALRAFEAFLTEADAPPEARARVEGFVADLRSQLAAGTVVLDVRPAGALVRVDGQVVGRAPVAPVSLEAGLHEIVVSHPDHGAVRRTLDVLASVEQRLTIDLVGDVPIPTPTPTPTPDLPASPYVPWAWGLLGTGLGVAGAGTVVYVLGELDHQEVTSAEGYGGAPVVGMTQRRAADLEASGDTKKTVGYVLWGVGGAAVVTSVILFAIDPGPPGEAGAVTVGAAATPGGAFVQVGGRF